MPLALTFYCKSKWRLSVSFFKGIAFSKVKQLISTWALSVMSTSLLLFQCYMDQLMHNVILAHFNVSHFNLKLKGFQKREILLWSSMYLSQWRSIIIKKSGNDVFSLNFRTKENFIRLLLIVWKNIGLYCLFCWVILFVVLKRGKDKAAKECCLLMLTVCHNRSCHHYLFFSNLNFSSLDLKGLIQVNYSNPACVSSCICTVSV